MPTEPTHDERVAISRLHALLELLPTALDRRLKDLDLTAFEFTVLEKLSEAQDTQLRLSALAAKTNATMPRLSRVASAMEKRSLVLRSRCPEDARATNLELTAQGAQLFARARPAYYGAVRELVLDGIETMPGDGVALLSEMTSAILSSLDTGRAKGKADTACDADPESPRD